MNLKFGGGQRQAVITKVCAAGREFQPNATDEQTLKGVLDGDLEIVIRQAERLLVDGNGRRIPPRGLVAAVCDANPSFRLNQPKLDYVAHLSRLQHTGLTVGVSADEFKNRSEAIIQSLLGNEQVANLLKGVHLPIVIPRMNIADLGEVTEKMVEAAGASYRTQFPSRPFTNHRKGQLAGQVSIVADTRYEKLIARLVQTDVVGIYFPACLQGFSVDAQREQMSSLPPEFILSGPLDAALGWMMYADILGRDWNTPGYDCSATQWRSTARSLSFGARDGDASFDSRTNLGSARSYYSGGLFILG